MAKRIEQSRRHGHYDARSKWPVLVVDENPPPGDDPAEREWTPPTLTLVGGTDVRPKHLDPLAAHRI